MLLLFYKVQDDLDWNSYTLICYLSKYRLPFVQEKALSVFRLAYDKAVALGYKLDIIFYQIRIGLFYLDNDLITRSIDKAKT